MSTLVYDISLLSQLQKVVRKFVVSQAPITSMVLLLEGNLGSGKTELVRQLASVFDITSGVSSPSFNLHQTYIGSFEGNDIEVHHFDLYRLNSGEVFDLFDISFFEEPYIVCVEWPQKANMNYNEIADVAFDFFLQMDFEKNKRTVSIKKR